MLLKRSSKPILYQLGLWLFVLIVNYSQAQTKAFTGYLSTPQLDTAKWADDAFRLLSFAPATCNKCQVCFTDNNDSIYNRSCFNSVSGYCILDTNLARINVENISGNWILKEGGVFEVRDSLCKDTNQLIRTYHMLDYQKGGGTMMVAGNKILLEVIENGKQVKQKSKYKIVEGRYITVKGFFGQSCGSICARITSDGKLILDKYSYFQKAKNDDYLYFKTRINRSIFAKQLP